MDAQTADPFFVGGLSLGLLVPDQVQR